MSIQQLNNLNLKAGLEADGDVGSAGQVLSSTGPNGVEWINQSAITASSDFIYYEVKNETGSTILKGKGVMAVGTDGNSGHILVDEMVADGTITPRYFLGVLETDIENGGFARVIAFGELDQFNTSGQNGETWSNGQVLWCDPDSPGDFTITEPLGPNVKIPAAFVLKASTQGKIQVRVQANEGVKDLYDTKIDSQVDGDVLVWDNTTGVWFNNDTLSVKYSERAVAIGDFTPPISGKLQISNEATDVWGTLIQLNSTGTQSRMSINNNGTGDSQINFQLLGSSKFTLGVDNSDSDKFKISGSSVLGSNDRFVIDSSGNVGIGTTSPSRALEINTTGSNNYQFRIGTNAYYYDIGRNTSNGFLNFYGNQSNASGFVFETVNGERMRIDHDGNVGIGTTSPSSKLTIGGLSLNSVGGLKIEDPSNTAYGANFSFNDSDTAVEIGGITNNVLNDCISIARDATRTITITSSQRVGIIETNPTQKLHVDGNARVTGAYYDSNNAPGTSGQILSSTETGTNWISGSAIPGVPDGSGTTNYLARWTDADTLGIGTTYDNGTNVGIGTTSPGERLSVEPGADVSAEIGRAHIGNVGYAGYAGFSHVDKNSAGNYALLHEASGQTYLNASAAQNIRFRINNTDKMILTSGGNFGVGTTSPGEKLTVKGTDQYIAVEQTTYPWGGTNTLGLKMGTNGVSGLLDWRRWTGSGTDHGTAVIAQVNSDGGYGLDFRVDNQSTNTPATTSRMFLSSSGEVGIGTTSPGSKLDVSGGDIRLSTNATYLRSKDSASAIPRVLGMNSANTFYIGPIDSYAGGAIVYGVSGNVSYHGFYGGGSEKVRITSAGNVGIGTTSPRTKLHVTGLTGDDDPALGSSTAPFFVSNTANSYGLNIGVNNVGASWLQSQSNTSSIAYNLLLNPLGGNVGIGTTSPDYLFEVEKPTGGGIFTTIANFKAGTDADNTGAQINVGMSSRGWFVKAGRDVGNVAISTMGQNEAYGAYDYMTFKSGNVGIGTTSPDTKLHIVDNDCYITLEDDNSASPTYYQSGIIFRENRSRIQYRNDPGFQGFVTSAGTSSYTDRLYLKESNGYLGIGTSPSYQLQLSLNSAAKPSSIYWTTTSDERVKTNIRQYEKSLEHVVQLNPKLYDYNGKAGFDPNSVDNIGFIAQDIVDIFPEAVKTYKAKLEETDEKETELYNIDFQAITFAMINSIKELNTKIEQLETRIQTLENN